MNLGKKRQQWLDDAVKHLQLGDGGAAIKGFFNSSASKRTDNAGKSYLLAKYNIRIK